MGNEPLPLGRRIPGAARAGPAPSARPVLTDDVLLRMQAAVDAAKAEFAAEEQGQDQSPEVMARAVTSGPSSNEAATAAARNPELERDDKPRAKRHKAIATARRDRNAHRRNRGEPVQPSPSPPAAAAANGTAPERTAATPASRVAPDLPKRTPVRTAKGSGPPGSGVPAVGAESPHAAPPGGTVSPLTARPPSERPAASPASGVPPGLPKRAPVRTAEGSAPPGSEVSAVGGAVSPRAAPPPAGTASPPAAPNTPADLLAALETTAPLARLAPAPPPAPAAPQTRPQGTEDTDEPGLPQTLTEPHHVPPRARTAAPERTTPPTPTTPPERTTPPTPTTRPNRRTPPGRKAAPRRKAAPEARFPQVPTPARSEPGIDGLTTRRFQPPHNPRPSPSRKPRASLRFFVGAAVLVLVAGAAFALLSKSAPPSGAGGLSAQQRVEQASETEAATWVMQQVSRTAVIACDPQMCRTLVAHGFPAGNTQRLGPTSQDPTGSTLVIDTRAVQHQFGTNLAANYAPWILTTIGSGPSQITIRVIAPHGISRYDQQLASDMAQRKQDGRYLAASRLVTTTLTAKAEMTNGQVDTRLLLALTAVAIKVPVDIVDFGNVATDASPDLPLRYVDLAESVPAARLSSSAYVKTVIAALNSSSYLHRYLWTKTLTIGGAPVLRIDYSAPSPLDIGG
jgi:hypothetical protein